MTTKEIKLRTDYNTAHLNYARLKGLYDRAAEVFKKARHEMNTAAQAADEAATARNAADEALKSFLAKQNVSPS